MILAAALLLTFSQDPFQGKLDELAKARDVAGLSRYLADPNQKPNPLAPIRTGGAYDTGRFGWRALLLRMAGRNFIVFSTPLTSEDIGELLFEVRDGKLTYVPEWDDNNQQIVSHEIAASFDLPKKAATLKDTLVVHRVGVMRYPPMLRIGPNYRVTSIKRQSGEDVPFLQAGGVVMFPELGNQETLTMIYSGVVNRPYYAGSISEREVILTNDYWYPMVARKPAPYSLTVLTPADWTAVGQGERLGETVDGVRKVTRFRMALPVSYYSFSASAYAQTKKTVDGRTFTIWSNAMPKAAAELQTELYPPIIAFYERFAKYPFTGYGAVVTPEYGGGALEAYSFATYGGGMLPGEEAHEPAHTWWGGMVNNTYLTSLWNESFAVFCEGFYARTVSIGNVEDRALAFVQLPHVSAAYKVAPPATASPFIGPAATEIGYGKGAYVLQMLEQEIGSENMVKAMQRWIREQPNTRGGEWSDFEAAVARVTDRNYGWFFDQWIRRSGWADFDIRDVKWANGRVSGRIVFKSEPYIIHSDVMVRDAAGKDTVQFVNLSETIKDKEQVFSFPSPARPALVSIDPYLRILRPIADDEQPISIERMATNARRFTDPEHKEYLVGYNGAGKTENQPGDLDGAFLVGHPDTLPAMKALCQKVGFSVNGTKLTYKGASVDLNRGGALAVVELGGGKRCLIGLGKVRHRPNTGRAKVALFDELGRFTRGETLPKTSGNLTFKDF